MKGLTSIQIEMYNKIMRRWKTVGSIPSKWAQALDILVNLHFDDKLKDEERNKS